MHFINTLHFQKTTYSQENVHAFVSVRYGHRLCKHHDGNSGKNVSKGRLDPLKCF